MYPKTENTFYKVKSENNRVAVYALQVPGGATNAWEVYIGSSSDLDNRLRLHKGNARCGSPFPVHEAMRKSGVVGDWWMEVIEYADNVLEARKKEAFWIQEIGTLGKLNTHLPFPITLKDGKAVYERKHRHEYPDYAERRRESNRRWYRANREKVNARRRERRRVKGAAQ